VVAAGRAPLAVAGRRRIDGAGEVISHVLAAPDVVWAGRTVRNPVQRLGASWVVDAGRAEHPETGSVLVADGRTALLQVPLAGEGTVLELRLDVPAEAATGAVPVVTTENAAIAMRSLVTTAAGGTAPAVLD